LKLKKAFIVLQSSELKGGIEEFNEDLYDVLIRNNINCRKIFLHNSSTNLSNYSLGNNLPNIIKSWILFLWVCRANFVFINQPGHLKYFKQCFAFINTFLIVHNPSIISKFNILKDNRKIKLLCVAQHLISYLNEFENPKFIITPPIKRASQTSAIPRSLIMPSFLYAGRIADEKNIDKLDQLSKHLNLAFNSKVNVFCNDLSFANHYENLCFHNWLTRLNLQLIFSQYTFYINLSNIEGMPISVREAMLAGCFPILSDIPAHREVVEHLVNGYLLPLNFQDDDLNNLTVFISFVISDFEQFSNSCIRKVSNQTIVNLENQIMPLLN
jgi:glycosyltransferase involved in cell wall biosynthesis